MAINTNNQKPAVLDWHYIPCSLAGVFDPIQTVKNNVVSQMLTPLLPSAPATIDEDGKPITADDITNMFFKCSEDTLDTATETKLKEILNQTLAYYDKSLSVQDVYAVQSGKQLGMPMPSPPGRTMEVMCSRGRNVILSKKDVTAGFLSIRSLEELNSSALPGTK